MSDAYNALTLAHQRFVDEYVIDCNASQAAVRSGYEPGTAGKLMDREDVRAAVRERLGEIREQNSLAAGKVVDELARLAFGNILDFVKVTEGGYPLVDLTGVTREQAAAIAEITIEEAPGGKVRTKLKLADKRGPLTDLGKNLGLFADWQKKDDGSDKQGYSARELIESRLAGIAKRIGSGSGT